MGLLPTGASAQIQINVKLGLQAPPGAQATLRGWNPRLQAVGPEWLRYTEGIQALTPANRAGHPLGGWFTIRLGAAADSALVLQALQASGWFSIIEPNRTRQLNQPPTDPDAPSQFYHPLIRTQLAWATTQGNASVRMAFIDTGIDFAHPEFSGQLYINPLEDANGNGLPDSADANGLDDDGNGWVDDVCGYDFVDQPLLLGGGDDLHEDPFPHDDNGHGTGVAGVMGARPNNGLGGYGIAPGCRLVPLRAFSAGGVGEDDDIARAILYAAENSLRVLNLSFGDIYRSQMMFEAIQYAYANGVVMVASAGNASGDNPHYPSDYSEVICVSGTAWNASSGNEFLWLFSNYGYAVDVCAPASGIWVPDLTAPDDGTAAFHALSGTSFAAPQVAAGAALLLSQNPSLTPGQVRAIVASTADDLGTLGWDHFTGGGRLNLERALQFQGGGLVRLLGPTNESGSAASHLHIVGTVLHPLLVDYRLKWRTGTSDSNTWQPLAGPFLAQALAETLAVWHLGTLPEGDYTLSLEARLANGQTLEDRVWFVRDTSPPTVAVRIAAPAWDADVRKLMVVCRGSDAGKTTLFIQKPGATAWAAITSDRQTRQADFLLSEQQLGAGTQRLVIQTQNRAGLVGLSDTLAVDFQPASLNNVGATALPYGLPMGAYLPHAYDLDGDGKRAEVVLSNYDSLFNFGPVEFWRFQAGQFSRWQAIGTPNMLIPKDIQDIDHDGREEFLANFRDSIYQFTQPGPQAAPTQQQVFLPDAGVFPSQWVDVQPDGTFELLARTPNYWLVMEWAGSAWRATDTLPDTTAPINGTGPPVAAVADVDADGRMEIWFGDYDGDVFVFERDTDGKFRQTAFHRIASQMAASNYLHIANLDADPALEVFVATHSSKLRNADFEYDAQYWSLQILEATADNQYTVVWQDYLFNTFSDTYNAATVANMDADSAAEVLLTAFPHAYLVDYRNDEFNPIWYGQSLATDHVVGDFNANGIPEFAIGLGDTAMFFELNAASQLPGIQLQAEVVSDSVAQLTWTALPGLASYQVWRQVKRGDTLSPFFDVLASLSGTTFADAGIRLDSTYAYAVIGNSLGREVPSNLLEIQPQPAIRALMALASSPTQVRVTFSGNVVARDADISLFSIDDTSRIAAILEVGARQLLLTLTTPLSPGSHIVSIDSAVLDAHLRRLLEPYELAFSVPEPRQSQLYLTQWEKLDEHTALLSFNVDLDAGTLVAGNFDCKPFGNVSQVEYDPAAPAQARVRIEGMRLAATGLPVSIRVVGARGAGGETIRANEGDLATFLEQGDQPSDVFVFPNPVKTNRFGEGCRFGGLPRLATITVLTHNGLILQTLQESDGDGGLAWDLRDFAGQRLVPGVYVYYVTTPEGQRHVGKFTLLE